MPLSHVQYRADVVLHEYYIHSIHIHIHTHIHIRIHVHIHIHTYNYFDS